MEADGHFVRLIDITRRYKHGTVVDGVSLEIGSGEFIALLGGSGSGKTTLLRIIAGLETPDAGQVYIAGELVTDDKRTLVPPHKRQIGFVFQDLALWPHFTIAESILFVLKASNYPKQKHKNRVAEVLALTRIERFGDRYPHQLSGGEQQRAALARAIAIEPRLLLLDEPMANLDVELKEQLRGELGNLQRELSLTTVYVTHDRTEITSIARRIAWMRQGKLEAVGGVELLERSESQRGGHQ